MFGRVLLPVSGSLCVLHCALGDVDFRERRTPGKLFNCVPVPVPGRKIHRSKVALRTQCLINETYALEEFRPINGGHEAHARNDIADRDIHRALKLILLVDDLLGGGSLRRQPFVQPAKGGCYCRILISQASDELHRKRRRQRHSVEPPEGDFRRFGFIDADSQQSVSRNIGLLALRGSSQCAGPSGANSRRVRCAV